MDAAQNRLIAPAYRFRFDKYFDAPDKNFFTYLSMQKQIPDYEAIRMYNQFAQDFRSRIMSEERLEWDEIGYFQKSSSGEVEFLPTGNERENYLELAPVEENLPVSELQEMPSLADQEKQNEAPVFETRVSTGDQPAHRLEKIFLYAAIGLLAIGLLVAGLHFGRYGFSTKAWSNLKSLAVYNS